MTETTPTAELTHAEALRTKLHDSPFPLKLAEVVKGMKPPKGVKAPQFKQQVSELLEEEVRLGRLFSQPSGKNGEARYWSRDERQHLRNKAIELAAEPQALAGLKTKLGKEVKGVDAAYVRVVLQELINDDRLYEHPPRTKAGQPLFGAARPRPLDRHKKALDKLVVDCGKLLLAAGVSAEELLQTLRGSLTERLAPAESVEKAVATDGLPMPGADQPHLSSAAAEPASLEEMILKAVADTPVMSLSALRAELPREFQGRSFDETVLRLADEFKVTISQDADPSRYSDNEAAAYVRDGGHLYTTIMARS